MALQYIRSHMFERDILEFLSDPAVWATFLTLTVLEIVLGIDNVIFLSIVSDKLPPERRRSARLIGLTLALLMRVGLLFSIVWLTGLTSSAREGMRILSPIRFSRIRSDARRRVAKNTGDSPKRKIAPAKTSRLRNPAA